MDSFPDEMIVRIKVIPPVNRLVGLVRWYIGRALLRAAAAMLAAPVTVKLDSAPGGGGA